VCCKSQDISCGMRKIENWSDHFGTEIALRRGKFRQNYSRVTTESSVGNRHKCLGLWQLLLFEEVTYREKNGEKVHWGRGVN
jgi:hypothetical protein